MDVFVSYARVDRAVVDPVVAALDRHGIPYWFDRRDIPVSFPWRTEIRNAIRTAAVVVVMESDGWHASRYCRAELEIAAELHKPVVHIDVHDIHPDEAVAIVEHALSALTRTQQAHADLLARSGSWDRNGRDRSGLVGGDLLERLHLVERKD